MAHHLSKEGNLVHSNYRGCLRTGSDSAAGQQVLWVDGPGRPAQMPSPLLDLLGRRRWHRLPRRFLPRSLTLPAIRVDLLSDDLRERSCLRRGLLGSGMIRQVGSARRRPQNQDQTLEPSWCRLSSTVARPY
jgi:hypothetical protein